MWKLRVFKVLILYTTVIFVPLSHASNAETGCLCSNTYSNFKYEDGPPDKDTTECFDKFDICYNKLGEFYQITKKNSLGDWSSCSSKCDENQNNENVDSANKPQVNLCRVKPTPCLSKYKHNGVEKENNECFTSYMCKVKPIPCFEKFEDGDNEEKYKCEQADQTNDETSDLSSDDYVCDFTPDNQENADSYGICQPESCLQDGKPIVNKDRTCLTKATDCVFPFKDLYGDIHDKCTNVRHCNTEKCREDVGFEWCATKVKENGEYLRWSVCDSSCTSYDIAPYKDLKRDFNWCATEIDETGKMTRWGLCDSDKGVPECSDEDSKDLVCEECIGDQDLCEKLCSSFDIIPIIVAVIIIVLILLVVSFLIWKYRTNLCPGTGTYSPPKAQAKVQQHGAFGSDMSGLDFIDKSNSNSIDNLIDRPQLQESLREIREMRVSDVP